MARDSSTRQCTGDRHPRERAHPTRLFQATKVKTVLIHVDCSFGMKRSLEKARPYMCKYQIILTFVD